MDKFKSNPENAADIQAMASALSKASIGETITYKALSEAIGRDVRTRHWLLAAARNQVEAETGALYETIRDVGVKRLSSEAVSDVGLQVIQKVRRTAKRGIKRLSHVRTNDLTQDEANKLIAHRSQLGAISLVADGRKSVTVAKEAATSGAIVPAGRVLDMFKS